MNPYLRWLTTVFPRLKLRPHERFFARAGDAIFSNFAASPARDENRTCSHPRTCDATGEKIARKKSPELKFPRQNRRDSARVATLQLSLVLGKRRDINFRQKLMVKSLFLSLCETHVDLFLIFFPSFAFFHQEEKCKQAKNNILASDSPKGPSAIGLFIAPGLLKYAIHAAFNLSPNSLEFVTRVATLSRWRRDKI